MKKFYPVNIPNVTIKDIKYVSKVMKNSWISADGPEVSLFEKKFSKFVNRKYSISVANGTAALEIAMKAINIRPGDEVIIQILQLYLMLYPSLNLELLLSLSIVILKIGI